MKWIAKVPYEGTAYIAIESEKEPTASELSRFIQRNEIDRGLPKYFTNKAEIEPAEDRLFEETQQRMKRKASMKEAKYVLEGDVFYMVTEDGKKIPVDIRTPSTPMRRDFFRPFIVRARKTLR